MCVNTSCPLAKKCIRNEKSGTKPDSQVQSYTLFVYGENGCEYFRSIE
jgi:benzoyl-CoA reductase/2-hydroxyglutaryl-CoA dehydratase subunit BcrC/BadD/HgdB